MHYTQFLFFHEYLNNNIEIIELIIIIILLLKILIINWKNNFINDGLQ
jgi:hypothetical protein